MQPFVCRAAKYVTPPAAGCFPVASKISDFFEYPPRPGKYLP
jgi:hypothetical protein